MFWRFLFFSCIIILSGCTTVFEALYGIKKLRSVNENDIVRYSEKFNIPVAISYELDTSYVSYLFSFDTIRYKEQIKNHFQPLQVLYYDRSGNLTSFQVNCYAGGFPNLKWNRNTLMTNFPPGQQAPLDSLIPLASQMKFMKPLFQAELVNTKDFDFIVIVYWSRFMGRQSKRLIRTVQENSKLNTEKEVIVIYANTDNLFSFFKQ